MGYTDSLLADGEVIAMRSKQHWLALLLGGRNALAVWFVAVLLFLASIVFNITGDVRNLLGIIILVLAILGLLIFAWQWLQWINQDYVVTNRRILKVSGIVNKRSMDSSLEKINDLVLEENLIGRVLDYGDLDIVTASDVAIDRFRMLNHAKTFKKEMLDQKLQLEQGDFYRPSPPMMATAPPGASAEYLPPPAAASPPQRPVTEAPSTAQAPGSSGSGGTPTGSPSASATTPASAPSTPAATELAADEAAAHGTTATATADEEDDEMRDVTRTLARLADLRDRGAITPEDYEAKKAELLGRL